jgi:phenylalanyl-tRNA synthetase alpha chain
MTTLSENEHKVLAGLCSGDESVRADRGVALTDLAGSIGLDQAQVDPVVRALAERGLAEMSEEPYEEYGLGKEGAQFSNGALPERLVVQALEGAGGQADISELPEKTGLDQKTVGQSLKWLKQKGWADKQGRNVVLGDGGRKALEEGPGPDEKLLMVLAETGAARKEALAAKGLDVEAGLKLLAKRSGFLKVKSRVTRWIRATPAGRELWAKGVEARRQVNELEPEMLKDGSWRQVEFRPYDMSLSAYSMSAGKVHPFQRVLQKTRRVFLEMGFEEVRSPYVESAFWDFDALFQPQDHPARDMQDTFYVGRPAECRLPDKAVVERVQATHVDGGDTGSTGWRVPWSKKRASQPVLRTHTTASTIRALHDDPNPPRKVFSVGRVFRRETVDYKHLPVFHQVDGIIIDAQASFATLLGTLAAFYRKMGFEKVVFRPAFFPYTEPSVEAFVWHEGRKDWFEMGGAGVFRPEVTLPSGCKVPVLAWGLGLERLAMFRYEMTDIRQTCVADVDWLKETPLCR